MRSVNGHIQLSASDLVNHLACRHLTGLDFEVATGDRSAPWTPDDPGLELLRKRGLAHEEAYLQELRTQGLDILIIGGFGVDMRSVIDTVNAMRTGREVIVQAALAEGRWGGRADVLLRVDRPSNLGDWSYEVTDTKLARETKGGTILQLSLYSDLVRTVQGVTPRHMSVVAPWTGFQPQVFRANDYAAYYRWVRQQLESSLFGDSLTDTYPEPKDHCDVCRWRLQCNARRRDDDHLSLVSRISSLQIDELKRRDVTTTEGLSSVPLPLEWKPGRGAAASYERVREQARVQVEGRNLDRPVYETLPPEPGFGFALLPEPSPGDVFFDFEGDSFVGPGGMEYLFGYLTEDGPEHEGYTGLWALNYEDEKRNFESFVDWVMERWRRYPDMHIYHYAAYEPSAMKRLMGRHATRGEEVDQMLRSGMFVDLYRAVVTGLRASVESYSIKKLEEFFGFEREVRLRDASAALHGVEGPLEMGDPGSIEPGDIEAVEGYNRDDCVATLHLRNWLEGLRGDLNDAGEGIERPKPGDAQASEEQTEWQRMVNALAERITADVPADPAGRDSEQRARWVLANTLDWHRREEKAAWWEYFNLLGKTQEELIDEREALSQLEFLGGMEGGTERRPVHRYQFPEQETALRSGDHLHAACSVEGLTVAGTAVGDLASIDTFARIVDIRKRGDAHELHPPAVFAHESVNSKVLKQALVRMGEYVAEHGITGTGPYQAARDLLLRDPPRLAGEAIRREGETALNAGLRVAKNPGFGVLAIQGPPGAGKTYTGARMICEFVANGARVGITGNSHKVIGNLLKDVLAAARERGLDLKAVQKVTNARDEGLKDERVAVTPDNDRVFARLEGDCQVGAGTAWLWARPEAGNSVDVLFVDEAAQMSLANVLAISHAAKDLVLLGDPQQLDQPTKGTHPEGADTSALAHLLDGQQTIGAEQGLFLEETWRLHPDICRYTSEVFYEDKLSPRPGLVTQLVFSDAPVSGSGLRFLPVSHQGCHNDSDEEADVVAELVRGLTDGSSTWIDQNGEEHSLTSNDVVIIAPYNAQVFKILDRLPGARAGTVDRFQGQQAPVVVYSMTTSTPQEAPHGMEFLFSLNRLNVATSRARCVCVLVGSPELFSPECKTPRQMRLANAFCRYRELATEIAL